MTRTPGDPMSDLAESRRRRLARRRRHRLYLVLGVGSAVLGVAALAVALSANRRPSPEPTPAELNEEMRRRGVATGGDVLEEMDRRAREGLPNPDQPRRR